MQSLNESTFNAGVNKGQPVVVDFYAVWCRPCNALAPILEKLEAEMPGVTFAKVNTDENPGLVVEHKVNSLPTLMLFRDGQPVRKLVGLADLARIKEFINT